VLRWLREVKVLRKVTLDGEILRVWGSGVDIRGVQW
jgi:hypothetical protein